MFTTKRIVIAGGLVALIGAALLVFNGSGGDGSSNNILITPRAVERRDLSDVLTVSGEVRRDETKKINSAVDGKVSQISVEDGDTVEAGDGVFALDGRTAVAVAGDFSFTENSALEASDLMSSNLRQFSTTTDIRLAVLIRCSLNKRGRH